MKQLKNDQTADFYPTETPKPWAYLNKKLLAAFPLNGLTRPQKIKALPVPTFENLKNETSKWIEGLNETETILTTQKNLSSFCESTEGSQCQSFLIEHSQEKQSWLADWWKMAYLNAPTALPKISFNFSLGMTFGATQAEAATRAITGLMTLHDAILKHQLKPEFEGRPPKQFPLEMSSYQNLFGCIRHPGNKSDTVEQHLDATHITVICNGRFYPIEVYQNQTVIDPSDLYSQLLEIEKNATIRSDQVVDIGVLTAQDRPQWDKDRAKILESNNKESLEKIESALFVVCLDPETAPEKAPQNLLVGPGNNRFWDCGLQVVVNGTQVGFIREHSMLDGSTLIGASNFLAKYLKQQSRETLKASNKLQATEPLAFKPNSTVCSAIESATLNYQNVQRELIVDPVSIEPIPKSIVKTIPYSDDCLVQAAFATTLALLGIDGSIYESVSTRSISGRTEAARTFVPQAKALAKVLFSNDTNKKGMLLSALSEIKRRQIICKKGMGVHRHLMGLKLAFQSLFPMKTIPPIFQDTAIAKLGTDVLSTSNCSSNKCDVRNFSYFPTNGNCIGIGYTINSKEIRLTLTTHRDNEQFLENFKSTFAKVWNQFSEILTE